MVKLNLKKNQRYKLCSCGISKILPFCDNQHRILNTENNVVFKSIKITPDNDVKLIVECKKWIVENE